MLLRVLALRSFAFVSVPPAICRFDETRIASRLMSFNVRFLNIIGDYP